VRAFILIVACAATLVPAQSALAAGSESAVPLRAGTEQFLAAVLAPGPMVSPLAIEGATLSGFGDRDAKKAKDKDGRPKKGKKEHKPRAPRPEGMALGPERARILLRSLTLPGWGQATLGRRRSAAVFETADLGIWVTFTSFRIQEQMRRDAYSHTARLGAGIDLKGRDEEFRRIVGAFVSSDEYNLFVVARDAANLYLTDLANPDMAGYRAYIAKYSLAGPDAWNWASREQWLRYGAQRKNAQRAAIRANSMLGIAIANRLVSALHAARAAGRTAPTPAHSWRFDVTPVPGGDATAYRAALSTSF
jgi:hypothetical protein